MALDDRVVLFLLQLVCAWACKYSVLQEWKMYAYHILIVLLRGFLHYGIREGLHHGHSKNCIKLIISQM